MCQQQTLLIYRATNVVYKHVFSLLLWRKRDALESEAHEHLLFLHRAGDCFSDQSTTGVRSGEGSIISHMAFARASVKNSRREGFFSKSSVSKMKVVQCSPWFSQVATTGSYHR
jgi:hypothetical protein